MTIGQFVPASDYLSYLFLENPWILAVILTLCAAIVGTLGWRFGRHGMMIFALASLLAAVGIVAMAKLVQTDREAVHRQAVELVEIAITPSDTEALANLLDENVTLQVAGATIHTHREQLIRQIQRVDGSYDITRWSVLLWRIESQPQDRWRVKLTISTTLRIPGDPLFSSGDGQAVTTDWEMIWLRSTDDAWRLSRINWTGLNGREPSKSLLP